MICVQIRKGSSWIIKRCIADGQSETMLDELNMLHTRSQEVAWVDGQRYSGRITPKRHLALECLKIFVPHGIRNCTNIEKAKKETCALSSVSLSKGTRKSREV
ncbi:uncharacterized protein MONOS_7672 [Monocercomonoides exilis]|uniref:uncharacterized protein n=1 Tax=Monocercomonoides exilis TaxID=2049356 RepID=UPI003559D10A|nr:hypothetical protein MONOS_7672 [Monocercomonoides exilis]|eukprot:MONOS_7672.1-p1 / transcript=MONOS_7672.1 / gene=MONOS_7672 / organism=Monocercomonoides_exilis_PA203 / gene_product=unspecified product / transcript_product=unspecified product / location=Mono_scaffold00268:32748-33056(-) / protein_length=103 / sequence_SO=supercontig / SO=protein_coding / is_pseudo=false